MQAGELLKHRQSELLTFSRDKPFTIVVKLSILDVYGGPGYPLVRIVTFHFPELPQKYPISSVTERNFEQISLISMIFPLLTLNK